MSYTELSQHFQRIHQLDSILGLLHWDMATMMPTGSAEARAEQMTTLKSMGHELRVDQRIQGWLSDAREEPLDHWQQANTREIEREYKQSTALSTELVEAMSRATAHCEMVWRTARGENDFAAVQGPLERVFELVREQASVLSEHSNLSPYDALLDLYEPGTNSAEIDPLFDELASFLPDLVGEIIDGQRAAGPMVMPAGPFDEGIQKKIGKIVMTALGFDFDRGRLDVSAHPFCGGSPDDVRITTRYTEADFMQSLMGIIHETGHALYERGLPEAYRGQPVGTARSMGIHESQSLLMEMQACRSPEFIEYIAPILRTSFGATGDAWSTDNLRRIYLKVERSLIRVDADEATYPLHVILRYRLERALLSGDLAIRDLPGAWRDGMKALIGVEPPNDTDGCMQDIHWHMGAVGYFPTYTLGAMNAAQLFDQATTDNPEILPNIQRGEFKPLLDWIRPRIHEKASLLQTPDLMRQATGRPLDAKVFRRHLEQRYLGVSR